MIDEADFQKIGNAAIDLCVFVEKLRLGKKHREEANKLTHNVLNLIKQTGKIKEEPLTKGKKMKKLKIQLWKAQKALAMQILEQEGLPSCKEVGKVLILTQPALYAYDIALRGRAKWNNLSIPCIGFNTNVERDEYLQESVTAITDELFTDELFTGEGELKIGEMCEVKDDDSERWKKRKLLAILPEKYDARFIVEAGDCPTEHSSWDCARPIAKRIEPIVEECGQLVTYTWEEK